MLTTAKVFTRGKLRHGNPSGDPQSAPRCGAKNRRGLPCQAPALRGKHRCRLHGGHSTGPRTLEGIERLRKANTQHGRFSAEGQAVARWCRLYFRNGYSSLRALARELGPINGPRARAHFERQLAQEEADGIDPAKVEGQHQVARAAVIARDIARLRAKGFLPFSDVEKC